MTNVKTLALVIIACVLLVFYIFLATLQYFHRRRKLHKLAQNFSCPPRDKYLRHTTVLKNTSGIRAFLFGFDTFEAFESIINYTYTHGPNFVCYHFFNRIELIVTHPKDLETIFSSRKTKKSHHYDFIVPWWGHGLLTSYGEKWHQRRKIITPSFHFKVLERFVDIFNEQSKVLVEEINKKLDKGDDEIDIYQHVAACTIDTISETAMGVKMNAQVNFDTEYINAVKEMSEIVYHRVFSALNQFPKLYALMPMARRERKVIKILHDFTNTVISQKRNELVANNYNYLESKEKCEGDSLNAYGTKFRMSFLDMLFQIRVNGEPLSHSDIREEVDTFMFAGHDTTTTAMTFICYELAMNPDIQEKVYDEITEVMGTDPLAPCGFNNLHQLKYLEMVFKEAMRLHPTIPIIGRQTMETMQIQGVDIPPGIDISIPIYAIHLNPKIFPDPKKFDPERFTIEGQAHRGSYDYIPFSAGFRNCIGQKFAMLEMKAMMCYILKNFKLLPSEKTKNLKCRVDLVLRPVNGMPLKLERRSQLK